MTDALLDLVVSLGTPKILVVGDLILDRYIFGDADRISPEAPVMVLRADQAEDRLGGAAGVAAMLSALGAQVQLVGVLGTDAAGRRCRELLESLAIDQTLVRDDPGRPTTRKERYVGRAQARHSQQILRVDYEVRSPLDEVLADDLTTALHRCLDDSGVVLVSDYDKGVCGPLLQRGLLPTCRHRGLRALVDPCFAAAYTRYRGASTLKPNRREAERATGQTIADLDGAFAAARQLRHHLELDVGLVTVDRDGTVLVGPGEQERHFPVRTRQVYDITGAGDMVLAVLGLVLAAGHDYPEAAVLANIAAGLQVERFGAATIRRQELMQELRSQLPPHAAKVVARQGLVAALESERRGGRTVVFTNGCFDLLHAGHVYSLHQAKAQGDVLVIGLNSDVSVRKLNKGPDRPIHDEARRAEVLAALACVDYVCCFDEETPLELIRLVRPDVLVKGADYRPEQIAGRDFVESYGGRLHLIPLLPGHSTTAVAQRLRQSPAPSDPP